MVLREYLIIFLYLEARNKYKKKKRIFLHSTMIGGFKGTTYEVFSNQLALILPIHIQCIFEILCIYAFNIFANKDVI